MERIARENLAAIVITMDDGRRVVARCDPSLKELEFIRRGSSVDCGARLFAQLKARRNGETQ